MLEQLIGLDVSFDKVFDNALVLRFLMFLRVGLWDSEHDFGEVVACDEMRFLTDSLEPLFGGYTCSFDTFAVPCPAYGTVPSFVLPEPKFILMLAFGPGPEFVLT